MDVVKVGWSGGKDSTCAMLKHLERGDKVKGVFYIPYLTDDIPLITKEHYEFIFRTKEKFEAMGAEMFQAKGVNYYNFTHRIVSKGDRKGKPWGTGLGIGYCNFRDFSKIYAIEHINVGDYNYTDIGIAFDEPKRQNQLNDKKRSILVELHITEAEAMQYVRDRDMLSPQYSSANRRDGCAICPNKKPREFYNWLLQFPAAMPIIQELEEFCRKWSPSRPPYREHMWWSDRIALAELQEKIEQEREWREVPIDFDN